jgi:hypothetical protein
MTPAEAIREARAKGWWFRPVAWRGTAEALTEDTLRGHQIVVRADDHVFDRWIVCVGDLENDWEPVDPDVVRKERECG